MLAGTTVVLLTANAAGAGWKVVVDDSHGFRVAALSGSPVESDLYGLSIMCPEPSQFVFVSPPIGDFSLKPGDRSKLLINGNEVANIEVMQNDSVRLEAWGDVLDLDAMIRALPRGDAVFSLAGVDDAPVLVPVDGLEDSLEQFAIACGV